MDFGDSRIPGLRGIGVAALFHDHVDENPAGGYARVFQCTGCGVCAHRHHGSVDPPTRNYLTTKPNRSYGEEFAAMGQQIRERRAVLVYFNGMPWRSYMPTAQALRAAFPSLAVEDTGDGLIFKAR
jgi:hypothetical protein